MSFIEKTCDERGRKKISELKIEGDFEVTLTGQILRSVPRESRKNLQKAARSHRTHEDAERTLDDHGAYEQADEDIKEILILEENRADIDSELLETSAETRKLATERRKTDREERRISDTSRVDCVGDCGTEIRKCARDWIGSESFAWRTEFL